MRIIDGDTIKNARRFSERPRERALAGAGSEAASAMA
jgi:hypothetical protein